MKKELEKKIKNLPYKYYMEVIRSEKVRDYGLNRKNLGKYLCKLVCDNGSYMLPTDVICLKLVKDLEELGLIKATADRFVVVDGWEQILQKKFPKALKKEEEKVQQQPKEEDTSSGTEQPQAPTPTTMTKVLPRSLKNNYEFYKVLLERLGGDFVSQSELRDSVLKLYKENFGGAPEGKQYFYNRVQFLKNSGILESIEDEGVVRYLRSSEWGELLEAKKLLLMKNPFKFKTKTKTPATEKPQPTKTPKEEKKPVVVQQELVCVCINPEDLRKLYETEIVFNDGQKCIVLIEPIPANLDVLKNIKVEVDPRGQQKLWEKFEAQRRYFADELRKIYRLCGKEA